MLITFANGPNLMLSWGELPATIWQWPTLLSLVVMARKICRMKILLAFQWSSKAHLVEKWFVGKKSDRLKEVGLIISMRKDSKLAHKERFLVQTLYVSKPVRNAQFLKLYWLIKLLRAMMITHLLNFQVTKISPTKTAKTSQFPHLWSLLRPHA